VDRADV
jgi:hypothetical protein